MSFWVFLCRLPFVAAVFLDLFCSRGISKTTCHSELCLQREAIEESQRVIKWLRFLDYKTSQEKQKQRMATNVKLSFWVPPAKTDFRRISNSNKVVEIPRYARNDNRKRNDKSRKTVSTAESNVKISINCLINHKKS